MSSARSAEIRSLGFGDPESAVAGVASVWDGGSCSTLGTALRVEGSGSEQEWRLLGEGVELSFAPAGVAAELELAEAEISVSFQLAHVRGTIVRAGGNPVVAQAEGERAIASAEGERAVDCIGLRSVRCGAPDGKRISALRVVCGWFHSEEALALLAARPRRARGHETDLVAGVLLEEGSATAIADPRLSSTYTAAGVPTRVGLELWLHEDEEAEQYPRRAAAQAFGASMTCPDSTRAELLRWRMRGRHGFGTYELVRAS